MKKTLSKLIESDLEQAEVVLAAKSITQDIQDLLEKVAKLRVDDLLPLVDEIKLKFDQATSEQYKMAVDAELEQLQAALTASKDVLDNQASILNGDSTDMGMGMEMDPMGGPDTGMGMDVDPELGMDDPIGDDMEVDPFAGSDASAGGAEPMGRMQKESRTAHHKSLVETLNVLTTKLNTMKRKNKSK